MDSERKKFLFAVIGAGPAGLMAAEVLSQAARTVTVYDRMPSAGRKFLLAGRGGLNLTHSESARRFLARYGAAAPHLRAAIEAFPPAAVRAWCEGLGQDTFVGSSGRVFPKAFKTSPLLRAWLRRLAGAGVQFKLRHRWIGWDERAVLAVRDARWTRERRSRCDGAGARRRKLAAARLRRRLGRCAGERRRRGRRRCGRRIADSSPPGPDLSASVSRAQPLKRIALSFGGAVGARRSDHHAAAVSKAARSTRCRRRCAKPSRRAAKRRCTSRCGRIFAADELQRRLDAPRQQAIALDLPAQGGGSFAARDRAAAGGARRESCRDWTPPSSPL